MLVVADDNAYSNALNVAGVRVSYAAPSFGGVKSRLLTFGNRKRLRHRNTLAHRPMKYRHGTRSNCGVTASVDRAMIDW